MKTPREFTYPARLRRRNAALLFLAVTGALVSAVLYAFTISTIAFVVLLFFLAWTAVLQARVRRFFTRLVVDSDHLVVATPNLPIAGKFSQKLDVFPFAKSSLDCYEGYYVLQKKKPSIKFVIPVRVDGYDDLVEFLSARVKQVSASTAVDDPIGEWLDEGIELRYGMPAKSLMWRIGTAFLAVLIADFLIRRANSEDSHIGTFLHIVGGGILAFGAYALGPRVRLDSVGIRRRFMGRDTQIPYSAIQRYEFAKRGIFELEGIAIHYRDDVLFLNVWLNDFHMLPRALKRFCPNARDVPKAPYTIRTKPFYASLAIFVFLLLSCISVLLATLFDGQPGFPVWGTVLGVTLSALPPIAYVVHGFLYGVSSVVFKTDGIEIRTKLGVRVYPVSSIEEVEHEYFGREHKFLFRFKGESRPIKLTSSKIVGSGFALKEALQSIYPEVVILPTLGAREFRDENTPADIYA